MSPEQLWAEKYAARHAEERFREEARREQAFLDIPVGLCGEDVRVMTPMDLLILNGIGNPFVCPGEVKPGDIAIFLWWLNVQNDHSDSWRNARRKKQMLSRVARLGFEDSVIAIRLHVEEVFQDAPTGGSSDSRRPLGTCFLVPMALQLIKATGRPQNEIFATPLPQLFQFMKALRSQAEGKDFVDSAPSDRITSEFLSELNNLANRN